LYHALFEQTSSKIDEAIAFEGILPPIVGDIAAIADSNKALAVGVSDQCNGSDVFC
jgi:hypothetical protein